MNYFLYKLADDKNNPCYCAFESKSSGMVIYNDIENLAEALFEKCTKKEEILFTNFDCNNMFFSDKPHRIPFSLEEMNKFMVAYSKLEHIMNLAEKMPAYESRPENDD